MARERKRAQRKRDSDKRLAMGASKLKMEIYSRNPKRAGTDPHRREIRRNRARAHHGHSWCRRTIPKRPDSVPGTDQRRKTVTIRNLQLSKIHIAKKDLGTG